MCITTHSCVDETWGGVMRRRMQSYINVEDPHAVLPQDEPPEIESSSSKSIRLKRFQCVAAHPDTAVPSAYRVLHIRSGYRPKSSIMASLPTLFSLHNQTERTLHSFSLSPFRAVL